MPGSLQDTVRRALVPRLVVAASQVRAHQRIAGLARRAFGRPLSLELYFAFDDPYAAIALPGLMRLVPQHPVQLTLFPLVQRGVDADPARDARRLHAVKDARLLARRDGGDLSRHAPIEAGDAAFLAAWTVDAREHPAVNQFAAAAVAQVWQHSDGDVPRQPCAELYRAILGRDPPLADARTDEALAANARRLHCKGHWESPAAWLCGEWFFAHERLTQIAARLQELAGQAA